MAYFFAQPGENPVAHAWWDEFVDRLLHLGPREPWGADPDTGAMLEVVWLEGDARTSFVEFVASAPEAVQEDYPSLRKLIRRMRKTDEALRVVYFPED